MRKKRKRTIRLYEWDKLNRALRTNIYSQFIVTYGIMTGIAIVSMLATIASSMMNGNPPISHSDLEGILISAYLPTTITLISTSTLEYDSIHSSRYCSSVFITAIVIMALFHTLFDCINVFLGESWLTTLVFIMTLILQFCSFFFLLYKINQISDKRSKKYLSSSDGQISAIRRH